mmetsp:Transcript_2576/g.5786  ORF Transcript_2576/g.5786 Transcript_2576/m.5786 type:complete len:301 (+) Transcript_2576:748-1650(+)
MVDRLGPGGAEHNGLSGAPVGHQADQPLDHVNEPHVQHAVSLVQDKVLYVGQVQGVLVAQILQPPWGSNQHIRPRPSDHVPLLLLWHPAVHTHHRELIRVPLGQGGGELLTHLGDLHGQLTGGGHRHEPGGGSGLLEDRKEALGGHGEVGQAEGQGLAAARLGNAAHITALQDQGPAAGLDDCRLVKLRRAMLDQPLGKALGLEPCQRGNVNILALGHVDLDNVSLKIGLRFLHPHFLRPLRLLGVRLFHCPLEALRLPLPLGLRCFAHITRGWEGGSYGAQRLNEMRWKGGLRRARTKT